MTNLAISKEDSKVYKRRQPEQPLPTLPHLQPNPQPPIPAKKDPFWRGFVTSVAAVGSVSAVVGTAYARYATGGYYWKDIAGATVGAGMLITAMPCTYVFLLVGALIAYDQS